MNEYRMFELRRRVQYTLLAGLAGAFLIPQVAFAGPTGEHDYTTGVNVNRNTANTTKITSTATNNVINWRDYSVNQGEIVQYDGGVTTGAAAHNYLNIVTGANSSNINGKIEGGNHVYIVNPNGVIIGKGATVNVGSLHVSTQEISTVNQNANMAGGVSPFSASAAGLSDVVNMGTINATNVEVIGKSIRFLNDAQINTTATTSPVVLHTANDGTAHIGYVSGSPIAAGKYTVNNAAATAADNYYQLVRTTTEFQAINNDLTKNYMLANDIDFESGGTKTAVTPIGGNGLANFTGKIDGNFFRVKNFKVSNVDKAGLFGEVSGARIENLGITGASVQGRTNDLDKHAGGLAADTFGNTVLKNVYVTDTDVDGRAARHGGIVGVTKDTTMDSVYSKARIGSGGGIIGLSDTGTNINNSYSDATVNGLGADFIYIIDPASGTMIKNSYSKGTRFASNEGSLTGHESVNTFRIDPSTKQAVLIGDGSGGGDMTSSGSYSSWGSAINNNGAPGAKWRIYEGRTTPLLTAFMSGTATATYNYRYFNADGTVDTDTGNTVKSNEGKDLTGLTYNSKYLKIVNPNAPTAAGDKSNVIYGGDVVDNNKVHDYFNTGTKDYDKTNGIRNVGTKAILWSDQDGPNLRGVNVTIDKRQVKLNNGNINPKRMYNGKKDVTDAFIQALKSGSISSDGFTQDDINAGSVQLDFTTGNFKAQMADKNVGTDKEVTFTGSIGFSGTDKGNYEFDGGSINNLKGKATIEKAPLYIKIAHPTAADKTYDGTSTVVDDDMKQSTSPKNITLDKSKTGPTNAQVAAGQKPQDGAVMLDDSDHPDDVDLKNIADPKYTDAAGNEQIHAGDHKLQYTGVGLQGADAQNYELRYEGTERNVENETVYLDGKIIPRQILRDGFKVYKTDGTEASAQKVYDGTSTFTPTAGTYLSSNAPASGNTGIVSRDQGHITFGLTGGADFTDDNGAKTKNVKTATKIAYKVTGRTDDANLYKLSDYYILDGSPAEKKTLDKEFSATGAGKITPKSLTAAVKNNHITKVYDAMQEQTDGSRHVIKGDALVTITGYVGSEKRTNTSTATYASKDVVVDGAGNPAAQDVTYNVSFDKGTGEESDNYTLDQTANTTNVTNTQTLSNPGVYTGTITPRDLTMKFADVTKVYDGTAENTDKTLASLDDGLSGAVIGADGITKDSITMPSGVTSSYGKRSGTTFTDNLNAGAHDVEYRGLSNALGTSNHNYKIADKQYGTGTITRRRIDPSGFQVLDKNDRIADATKVYDGTADYNLPNGAKLVTPQSTSTDEGIVSRDYKKITFRLKNGVPGHFTKDAAGNQQTSHVSEAHYVAYDIVAQTSDATNNPLTNYTFGPSGTERNLETVNDSAPAHATAAGSITPAALKAVTKEISKVYDGLTAHTDGNRNVKKGDTIVDFTGWVSSSDKRENTSTAEYADKNVSRDASGNIIKKGVTYQAQLTGQYADDYQIVNNANAPISTRSGSGAGQTVTASLGLQANKGTITSRKLNITMGDVSKTYDGTEDNPDSTITGITDTPSTSAIGAILSGDNINAADLNEKWQTLRSNGDATSSYGRGTGAAFREDANASNGTPHEVKYTNMKRAFRDQFGTTAAGNYTVDTDVYGKGTIKRKEINPNNFQVVDVDGHAANATKVYDGTSNYNTPEGWHLTPSVGPHTGVVDKDKNKITFDIDPSKGAYFTSDQAGANKTANVADAAYVAYHVKAETSPGNRDLLKNYTLNGKNLESGEATASGTGTITRRQLTIGLVQNSGIDKVYDGTKNLVDTSAKHWNALTEGDSRGNVAYERDAKAENKLVRLDGARFDISSSYADKNVKRNSSNHVVDQNITYNVKVAGGNYTLSDGHATVNAENGLTLSATGKITPKDLSGAFKKITKVYDGTKNVNAADVGFEMGAGGVIAGDNVGLASGHIESFQSENVRGDGTTWTAPDGTTQHNWVNYSGLTLSGTDAGNYNLALTAKGLGEITPFRLTPGSVNITAGQATKVYDGNTSVWKDSSKSLAKVKEYISSATVMVNGNSVNVLDDLNLTSAAYDSKNVNGGASHERVTYNFTFSNASGNFALAPNAQTLSLKGDGVITPKDVVATIKGALTKTYDATTAVKNAAGAALSGNDLVTLTGLVAGDGATNGTTAVYDNKNAGTGKTVTYNIGIDADNAGNYRLVDSSNHAITGTVTTNNNTITKRKVDLTFADVQKNYDTTATNTSITASVSAADAAVLNRDRPGFADGNNKLTGLTGITSEYGTGTGDAFAADPNAGTKTVRYQGVSSAMNNVLAGDAGNYEFTDPGFGTGRIDRIRIKQSDFTFKIDPATKEYDGTKDVVWTDPITKKTYGAQKYFRSSTFKLNGNDIPINPDDITLNKAAYRDENVAYPNNKVDYEFTLSTKNFDIEGGSLVQRSTPGTITPRDLTTKLPQHLVKEYDGKDTLTHESREYVERVAKDNLTTVVARDKGKVHLAVKGTYHSKDASVDTKAEADARTKDSTGVIGVDYELTLTADDANLLANYTIGGHPTQGTATGTADIYRKTLTVDVNRKVKDYDGTAATPGLSAGDVNITGGFVEGERFTLDQGAANQISGQYLDTNGNADANVARDANGNVIDKGVSYSGFNNAFKDLATRNAYAKNYVVADDRKTYRAADAKGRINPLGINTDNMKFKFKDATKIYDGTTAVKHGESAAPADVKKYLYSAKIKIGGNDVTIDNRYFNIDTSKTHYDNKNVQGGAKHEVTYAMTYTGGGNFTVKPNTPLTGTGDGYITRKGITAEVSGPLTKVYDATASVYDAGDSSIKTYLKSDTNRRSRVTKGDSLVTLRGLVDDAVNETTAEYDSKYVGDNKQVTYRLALDAAHADNYEFVDGSGNALARSEISTNGNEITRRTLNISFKPVSKTYDTTADNKDVRAFVDADDAKVLARDGMTVADGRLTQLDSSNIRSLYGSRDRAKDTFTPNPNAGEKDVQYKDINRTMRSKLSAGAQDNYEIADVGYGTGTIEKVSVSRGDFNFHFDRAVKEYDGTADVKDAKKYLRTDGTQPNHSTVRLKGADGIVRDYALPEADVESMTGAYTNGVDASTANNPVQYGISLNVNNYSFSDGVGRYSDAGTVGDGLINRRRIVADIDKLRPTKTYDGNNRIVGAARDEEGRLIENTDGLVHFKQLGTGAAGIVERDRNGHVRNESEATFADQNVAWEDYAAGKVKNKDVDYTFTLAGDSNRLSNYELVDADGNSVAPDATGTKLTYRAKGAGRINPVDITLKADEKTIWINDGLPKPEDYTGTPSGKNYETGVNNEVLPGTISYGSPNARLRWGDYAINGTYTPADGDTVYRNYRFVQDPGNATALHVGPYIPDANYYNIMTQNKMTPDEYAYENASLDRRSHFKRALDVHVEHSEPALNSMQDDKNVRMPDIYATDDAVFALMNEVFH